MNKTDNPTERGGFWSSMPGVLTALATLVTAVFGGYLGYQQLNKDSTTPSPAPVAAPAPAPAPPANVYVTLDAAGLSAVAEEDPGSADPVEGCAEGNEDDCMEVLNMLTEGCESGDMEACDLLYEVTPAGSDYEEYGGTCGYRDDGENAGDCEVVYG